MTKLLGERFTLIEIDSPEDLFFEGLYQSGFYWNFLGGIQMLSSLLLLIPRTTFLGTFLFFLIIISINIIVFSMDFEGTPIITSLMLLANIYLLLWDYNKSKTILKVFIRK